MARRTMMQKIWNVFAESDSNQHMVYSGGSSYMHDRPTGVQSRMLGDRSIINAIYNKIAIDVASVPIRHVQLDDSGRYLNDMTSSLNRCLVFEPNIDQSPRHFIQDIVDTMMQHSTAVIIPIEYQKDKKTDAFTNISNLRVGHVVDWYAKHVRVSVYNEATGMREDVVIPKRHAAIIENPFARVMNQPNSTLQRLVRKLELLDMLDDRTSSGKLDLIIQLPFVIKSDERKKQAEKRRLDIEQQLSAGKYGVAYTDGTEKITQLNRPVENNLPSQIDGLTKKLHEQLGLTSAVMDGTAGESEMLLYQSRTIQPFLDAIVQSMQRAFVGEEAKKAKQEVKYFPDLFKLIPIAKIAEISDSLARNEIISANEIRQILGLPPSTDPKADMLINSNMPQGIPSEGPSEPTEAMFTEAEVDEMMEELTAGMSDEIDKLFGGAESSDEG